MRTVKVFIVALTIFVVNSCKTKQADIENQINNLYKFREYIAEVTQGVVSTKADVRVVLRNPVANWQPNQELGSGYFEVSPKVKGKAMALNNQTIAFVPEEPLAQDTDYLFSLNLKKIIPDVPSEFNEFNFQLKTLKQQFNVVTDNIQSYSKDWQFLEGTLRSADVMPLETAVKLVKVTQKGKTVKVTFDASVKEGNQFFFKIDSIQRFVEDSDILISWDGTPFSIDSKGEYPITIPGKNNFTIIDVTVTDTGDQLVEINFSDPLKKGQEFNGLVTLDGAKNLTFSVDGNVLKAYPSQRIQGTAKLEVFQGIQSVDGYKLKNIFAEDIAFEQLKPEVRLLQSGVLLPSSNNLKINFEAVNLKAVDVTVIKIFQNNILQFLQYEDLDGKGSLRAVARPIAKKTLQLQSNLNPLNGKWRAYALDLRELISPEPGAIYRVEFSFGKSYSAYRCENAEEEPLLIASTENFDEEINESSYWNAVEEYYDDYSYGYDYRWEERENPCHNSYYVGKKVSTNVLAGDIGLVVKKGANNSFLVAAADIVSTQPLEGVNIVFYNYQQQEVGRATTEEDGKTIFDAQAPVYFAIAEKGNQKTYVKLNDGNALSVSTFDVAGVKLQKGIKGFIYGERGVWRPGDTLFLSFVLNDKSAKLPQNHPVKLELIDPYGKIVHREVQTLGVGNFYSFMAKTDENAPTGNWQAKVSVGGAVFTERIRIETIKPNRLKIKAGFDADLLSSTKPVSGSLEALWLHGAIAKNLKADVQAKFSASETVFKSFPGYVFDDPTRNFASEEQTVFSGVLNDEGKANFSLKPQLKSQAPGMLKASFVTKVYEPGGDFSTDVFTKTYSPYQTYVGLNTPKGDQARGMLLTDTKHRFDVVTVDENGKPKSTAKLKVSIFKVDWRWWWDTSEDNLSSYNASEYRENVFSKTISTNNSGKGVFEFELKYPEWGRYLVLVEDETGGHSAGKTIYIDWPGWAGKSKKGDPTAATMLSFSTDKEKYNVGEKAIVTFPASGVGRALVTVENGTEVLESIWVEPQKGETKFELPILPEYTPNVYINITLLQPHASTANDLPIRLYGIRPVTVENPETRLMPVLTMPNVLKPEETVALTVKEQKGRAMTYTVAIVDEGLLDLTRFKTPNPWDAFNAREALGVKTWDIYDDVIGAFGGRIDQVFSIGGDEDAAGAKNKKADRFKPMVLYLGPFTLEKGQSKTHQVKIPKYVGSVRTMVIAGNADAEAYGITEKTTPVRKPLMVLASLPRKVTPGERITLPVTVFAMENKVKNASISLKSHKAFKVFGEGTKTLSFSQPDEKMAYFDLEVGAVEGIGKIVVEASGNGEKATYELEVDVVNPNPVTTTFQDVVLQAGERKTLPFETFGVAGSNTAQLEFSTLPPMNFSGRMKYLIQYPHGCLEQTTSAAFPQLYLSEVFELSADKKREVQRNVESAIKKLGGHQLPNGGFAYWSGQNSANDWSTSYAGHFLLEAAKKGYVLPITFKSNWINYQKQAAKQWRASQNSSDLAQAYRLYTLALAGSADVASMNRLRETQGISNDAKARLAAAYALIGQKSAAAQIVSSTAGSNQLQKNDDYTFGSNERNKAMQLETYVLLGQTQKAKEVAENIAKSLSEDRWMSTQTTAYCLLAMAKYAKFVGGKGINAAYLINSKNQKVASKQTLAQENLTVKQGNNALEIVNNGEGTLFVRLLSSGILPVGEEKTEQRNLRATVDYKGRDGKELNISELSQGTNFVAEVTITNLKNETVQNVALTEIFPGGWEIVNTRFTDFGDFAPNAVTHTDIRDDRSNFYFDLKPSETKTLRVLLNSSYLGKYYLPGMQCEAMYDANFMVRTQGRWVEVVQ